MAAPFGCHVDQSLIDLIKILTQHIVHQTGLTAFVAVRDVVRIRFEWKIIVTNLLHDSVVNHLVQLGRLATAPSTGTTPLRLYALIASRAPQKCISSIYTPCIVVGQVDFSISWCRSTKDVQTV